MKRFSAASLRGLIGHQIEPAREAISQPLNLAIGQIAPIHSKTGRVGAELASLVEIVDQPHREIPSWPRERTEAPPAPENRPIISRGSSRSVRAPAQSSSAPRGTRDVRKPG